MGLNVKPVQETVLAPFALVVVSSNSALDDERFSTMLRKWTASQLENQSGQWSNIAERNKLLFENEKGNPPFSISEVYEGDQRWATILKRGPQYLELSFGLRVDPFGNLPSQTEIAKDAELIVPHLTRHIRGYRFWRRVNVNAEIMVNRTESNIQLSMPPSFPTILISGDVLKSLIPLSIACLGGLISALKPVEISTLSTQLLKFALISTPALLVAYLIVAFLHWTGSRADVKWVLAKG